MAKETINKIKFSDRRAVFASLGSKYIRNMKERNRKTDKKSIKQAGHKRRHSKG